MSDTPRIYTRCPACGNDTLTINSGHLLCTWIECPNPCMIDQHAHPLLVELAAVTRERDELRRDKERQAGAISAILGYADSSKFFGAKEVKAEVADLDNWLAGLQEHIKALDAVMKEDK